MKPTFNFIATLLALLACITALGTLSTLLYDAAMGVPGNVGPLGAWVVGGLLLGQCRILWMLVDARRSTARRTPRPATTAAVAAPPSSVAAQ